MPRQLRVFLCHASQDKPAVRELYQRLKAEKWIDPWLDEEKLLGGQDFDLEIYKATRDADAIIICLSKKSVIKEGYVNKEIRRALDIAQEKTEGAIYVIPLRLDECYPSFEQLKKLHWVDYFAPDSHEKLLQSLRTRAIDLKIKVPEKKAEDISEKMPRAKLGMLRFGMIGVIVISLLLGGFGLNSLFSKLPDVTSSPSQTFTETSETPTQTSVPFTPTVTGTPSPSATPTTVLGIGSTSRSLKDGMVLAYVPAGEFTMGSEDGDDERPVHQVYLDAFWIDQTEVTNEKYLSCVEENQCNLPDKTNSATRLDYFYSLEFNNHPVIFVSWNDADDYCKWAGRRLPTEAEWEKAARGTDGNIYPWGNVDPKDSLLNYKGNYSDTTEVGRYPDGASVYGVFDMAGNVWEWVNDIYDPKYYQTSPARNPSGPESGDYRVLRGGSWDPGNTIVKSTYRYSFFPKITNGIFGFRCALDATP